MFFNKTIRSFCDKSVRLVVNSFQISTQPSRPVAVRPPEVPMHAQNRCEQSCRSWSSKKDEVLPTLLRHPREGLNLLPPWRAPVEQFGSAQECQYPRSCPCEGMLV